MVSTRERSPASDIGLAAGRQQRLRIAFIAGTLTRCGAEKQLVYMARALHTAGVDIRVFSLTRGEACETMLLEQGVPTHWVGARPSRLSRLVEISRQVRRFRPHIVQSTHFFANLYAALGAKACGAVSVGAMRNDLAYELADNGRWGRWLLRAPAHLIVNSRAAKLGAESVGRDPRRTHLLTNVIDLEQFDAQSGQGPRSPAALSQRVLGVGRLVPAKRFDRFLIALARARTEVPGLTGLIAGEGPERSTLQELAASLGLMPDGLTFLGRREDVPALMRSAHMLVHCADHEGFPNVVLEAMAARLPVITTPAGDAGAIVEDGLTGFVVQFEDVDAAAERIVFLARSPERRAAFGLRARAVAEEQYSFATLADRLVGIYSGLLGSPYSQEVVPTSA